MKVGDKVIVNPRLPKLYEVIWRISLESVKDRIMTIKSIGNDDGTSYCYVEEEIYIFPCSIFIPVEDTLFLAIRKRRQYEKRR